MVIRRSEEHTRILRQKVVSGAKLRGMKSADIVIFLAEKEILNPRTGEPWSVATIDKDIRRLEESWKDEMSNNISQHRARILAELHEVKAASWQAGKLNLVLRAIDQETDLLGLNELERMNVEIALTGLLKGFPKEIADELKALLAEKVEKVKAKKEERKLIPFRKMRNG